MAIENFYEASTPLAKTLAVYFEALFPEAYERSKNAFDAGVWVKDDPGPWIGRALIYKLQGSLHVDDKDEGPTVSFPCGYFEGGEMVLPQLDAKLRCDGHLCFIFRALLTHFSYKKGHVLFFESSDIYHYVSKFSIPPYHSGNDNCTPGRIGSVFFSPKKSMEELAEQEAGWGYKTKFGKQPTAILPA
jgi:hypothetical protein